MKPRKRNIEGKMILMKNVRMALSGRFEKRERKKKSPCLFVEVKFTKPNERDD